jgi:phosphoribosylaminoimidazolecarboxamide formyltransferase/IMP cyclohydrolase
MAEHGIGAIDLLVLNLYPFERVSRSGQQIDDIIENIDIGGPAMLRVGGEELRARRGRTDPAQYAGLLAELDANGGALSAKTRFALSVAAFNRVAQYDAFISNYLSVDAGRRLAGAVLRRRATATSSR